MLQKWDSKIQNLLLNSNALFIAIFNIKGELIFSNAGFKRICKKESSSAFINPNFNQLIKLASSSTTSTIITIGDDNSYNTSFQAEVSLLHNELLIFGELNIYELARINTTLAELNRTNSNLQRELIKEKKMLQLSNNQLAELNENKNLLLGTAAHDIRNPIGSAFAFSEFMLDNYNDFSEEEIRVNLDRIRTNLGNALALLNSLLDASAINSGKINLKLKQHNYIDILKQAIESSKTFASKKRIDIELLSTQHELTIEFDAIRITQVINNLISNAIKFSFEGSAILIKVSLDSESVKTEIIDRGQGINIGEIDQLFEPFHTTTTKPTNNEKSTGLGLSIVKKVIELHNGKLEVHSTIGEGSNFTFFLPV